MAMIYKSEKHISQRIFDNLSMKEIKADLMVGLAQSLSYGVEMNMESDEVPDGVKCSIQVTVMTPSMQKDIKDFIGELMYRGDIPQPIGVQLFEKLQIQ